MSLYINFEPHSWYKHFAIQDFRKEATGVEGKWSAWTDDGNTYRVIQLEADTLRELKYKINKYINA